MCGCWRFAVVLELQPGLDRGPLQCVLDGGRDSGERDSTVEERSHRLLVRTVEGGRSGAPGPQRLPGKTQAGEPLQVRTLEVQRTHVGEIE